MASTIDPAVEKATQELRAKFQRVRDEIGKAIVGHDEIVEGVLTALFVGGHVLLEGVPGLGKTYLIRTLADALDLKFSRIQFTPDLMPADIIGTTIISEDPATGKRSFEFQKGPLFAQIVLADEINRATPKTQSALLEAMQEHTVTTGGTRFDLEEPFFVMATQNPIEQEGTYPLPEAQQDRFLFKVFVNYPSYDEEYAIAERTTTDVDQTINEVLTGEEIRTFQRVVRRIPAAPDVIRYALNLVRATRPKEKDVPEAVRKMITWGAGPRAVQALVLGGKARAALKGRTHLAAEDVRAVAHPVLRHRLVTNFSAEAQGYSPERIIDEILAAIDPNQTAAGDDERYKQVLSA